MSVGRIADRERSRDCRRLLGLNLRVAQLNGGLIMGVPPFPSIQQILPLLLHLAQLITSFSMTIQHLNPSRAACAEVALARFPVEEQEMVSNPNVRAFANAVATTRSLKLKVGRQTASFLMKRFFVPIARHRPEALMSGVKPTGSVGWKSSGSGSRAE